MHRVENTYVENTTLIWVEFETSQVEYHHTYISYDLLSLVGEVGGILGLTLGVSVLTFLESILYRFPHY